MGNAAVHNVNPGNTLLHCVNTILQLGQHAASQHAAVHKGLGLIHRHLRDKGGLVIIILEHTLHVREEGQLLRLHRCGHRAGCVVRVDIVALEALVKADGADNRKKILLQQVINHLWIHLLNLPHKADILAAGILFPAF